MQLSPEDQERVFGKDKLKTAYHENNEEQNKPEEKLVTTNFEVKVENGKLKGSLPIRLIYKYSN